MRKGRFSLSWPPDLAHLRFPFGHCQPIRTHDWLAELNNKTQRDPSDLCLARLVGGGSRRSPLLDIVGCKPVGMAPSAAPPRPADHAADGRVFGDGPTGARNAIGSAGPAIDLVLRLSTPVRDWRYERFDFRRRDVQAR